MVKILRTFLLGISVLLTLNINAQATYIRPCYSINAGLDSSICAINCVTINRTAIPQYLNKATNTYVVQQMTMPSPLYNNTGTNVIVNTDDVWSGIVNIGFNFCYFGNTYNKLVIGANGIISFNTAYANAYCPWSYTGGIPDATKPINSIMGVYTDVDPSVGFNANRINYYTEGVAPCRRFVINYYRVPMYSCNALLYTTQIVLHEAYNIIDVIVVNKPVCSSWNGGRGIIGIQNAAGNTAFSAPGNNPSTSAISNQCWRFIPNGALMQSVSWYQGATQVSNTDVLSASLCPTSSTVFETRLLNTRCDGSSVTVTDTVRFNVNLGGANAGVDKTLSCITPNITIGTPAQPNTNYTWTPGAGLSNPNIAQPSTNTPNTYILTATNTITGCSAKDTVIVGPKTFPVADAGPNKTITCANPSIQIGTTYVPGIFYAWSPATGLSSTSIAQPLASQPRMYYLTVTDSATGCTGTDSVMVTIDTIRPTADAGLDKSISCTFPNAQIGTSAIAGNSYTWLPPTGLSNPNIAQPIASSGGTYMLTVTKNSNGCTATDNVLITADTIKPTANAGLDDTLTCSVPSIVLGTTAVAGNSYVWSPPLGLNNPNIAQPTASQPNTYTLTVTKNANGCTATDAVTILRDTVKPIANAGRDSLLTCAVLSIPIGTTAVPGMNYTWSPSGGLSSSSSAQPNASLPNTYTVTVTNPVNGCSKS
ncbi:MAG TPA: hypothetical protein PLF48_02585, partial [Chitinophagales bacterium]|nr:hypothetical protein [Chitinophagales bacterium]